MHRTSVFSIACFLFALAAPQSDGQTPARKIGFIRFWDMLPATSGAFDVRKVGAPVSEAGMLSATAYRDSGYAEFPIGRYRLGVFRMGQDQPLKIFDVDLRPDTYFTILISPKSIDLFDDTIDPKATTGTLTVRNYFSGVTVAVSSGDQKIVDGVPYGQSYTASGLPISGLPVTLLAQLPNGQPTEAGADVDFKTSKRVTLLIIPDSYGRFRPRVSIDGKNL